uniref:Uncharacterized protein n=1 Tax=Fagus sylvatica TaxID=28930 RepID=A0A2N9GAG7_FAGSY
MFHGRGKRAFDYMGRYIIILEMDISTESLVPNVNGNPVRVVITKFEGSGNENSHSMYLDPPTNMPQLTQVRGDGWMEIKMGEFFNEHGDDGNVVFSVFDYHAGNTMNGLTVEGIELRPRSKG